ncbi:GntR family transcriptional regulator [Erythrobacter sp.]|uniref:GntR family transcriptional regulator n=1 Tax=Erythrobacter sp. TaxID=1042 RepID=UPI00311E3628
MSPAHVLEPTYRRLKLAVTSGERPSGSKLEAMRIADEFGVSMSPVRDSLNQLVGEGLVELRPGLGFHVPPLTESELRDLLDVNRLLLEGAIGLGGQAAAEIRLDKGEGGYADRLAAAFAAIATGSGNRMLAGMVDRISERLNPLRIREDRELSDSMVLLDIVERSVAIGAAVCLEAIALYHDSRQAAVPRLITLLAG